MITRGRVAAMVLLTALVAVVGPGGASQAVIGGVSNPGGYPYFVKVVVMFNDGEGLCGGSVIADEWVLTAAHCFFHDGSAYAGTDVTIGSGHGLAADPILHPLFFLDTHRGHDLTLVRVDPSRTKGIVPVRVGAPGDPGAYAPNTPATIMGFGQTKPGGATSSTLLAVDTVLHSDAYMDDLWNPWYWYDRWPDELAIGAGARGQTACKGDSGGPLVVYRNGTTIQVGVASFTKTGCNTAAGFAELAGPQLAWVASMVPSIVTGWGFCPLDFGTIGRYRARYTTTSFAGAKRDGRFYWDIDCVPFEPPTG